MMSTKEHEKRHRSRCSCSPRHNPSVFSRIMRERSRSPKQKLRKREGGVFKRLGDKRKSVYARSDNHNQHSYSRYTEAFSESKDNGGSIGNQDQRKRNQVGRKTTCPSHGYMKKSIILHPESATLISQKPRCLATSLLPDRVIISSSINSKKKRRFERGEELERGFKTKTKGLHSQKKNEKQHPSPCEVKGIYTKDKRRPKGSVGLLIGLSPITLGL
nr:hypothetical protein [Tanacetum cinerariifolium]